jgi:polyribonucleotide nucleotidyltransferase
MNEDVIQKSSEQKIDRRRKEFRQQKPKPEISQVQQMEIDEGITRIDTSKDAAAARTQTRSSARTRPDGRIEVEGRGGEVLSRTRTYVGDIFEVPQSDIPKGWGYQWNAVSIAGNSDILLDQSHMMHQNG